MSLSIALHNAKTGLGAASKKAEVTAGNVANASTPGYARRELEVSSRNIGGQGAGVLVEGVSKAENAPLTQSRREADADAGRASVAADAARRLQDLVGDPDDPDSLFDKVAALEGSLRELSNDPGADSRQRDVLTKAHALADGFNQISGQVQTLRASLDRQIGREVDTLNTALVEIETLNKRIRSETALDVDSTESRAQRDALIDQISGILPVQTILRDDGQLAIYTENGLPLVDGRANQFDFRPAQTVSADMDYLGPNPGDEGDLGGLFINGFEATPTVGGSSAIPDGSLAGLFHSRDVLTVDFQRQIDSLAEDLIDRFADAAIEPNIVAGTDPGLFTEAGGLASGDLGMAGRLEVNALVDPAQGGDIWMLQAGIGAAGATDAGDNTHVVGLLGAMTEVRGAPAASGLTGSASSADLVAGFSSNVATTSLNAEADEALTSSRQTSLADAETKELGVDIDTELQELNLIQTTYGANARLIQVVDEMLALLLEI